MSNNVVLYHASCNDGFCAAYLFWKMVDADATFIPVQYGEPPRLLETKDKDVYILDFSYARATLEDINAEARSLLVLDHHKTAENELKGLEYCTFDMHKSGARLTWDHVTAQGASPAHRVSWLVDHTEDRDLWRWALPLSREINAALASYPREFHVWDELERADMIHEGTTLLRYQRTVIDARVWQASETKLAGYVVPIVNCTELISEVVGELAEQFGGGGHARAAGFTRDRLLSMWEKGTTHA
jgi:oligoribonuclease NrnB/cAMP/cGMP phosphodiesterase (DHH superfamily)